MNQQTRELLNCHWCGLDNRRPSEWEQESLSGSWRVLCVGCADRRLGNPYNALLPLRRRAARSAGGDHGGRDA